MIKLKKIIILIILLIPIKCIAEIDKPYEENKNFRFSVNDIDSDMLKKIYDVQNTKIPSKFNLKDELYTKYGIKLPVAEQAQYGLCYVFSTVKSAETNYALKSGKYLDLSERYFDYMEVFKSGDFDGEVGEGKSMTMTLLETYGAPLESEIPYRDYSKDEYHKIEEAKPALIVTSTVTFNGLGDLKDQSLKNKWLDILKTHIIKYGSIQVAVCDPNELINENNAVYYKSGHSECGYGHGVSIVGWDDNYSRDNFSNKPEHDGAFICLNSWGDYWGDSGYFYVSYDDDTILFQPAGVIDTKVPSKYTEYAYSKNISASQGFIPSRQLPSPRFYAMKFERKNDEEYLSHITIGGGVYYIDDFENEIKIYINLEDDSFDKNKMTLLGITNSIGNETTASNISLEKPLKINGDKFSIVLEFSTFDLEHISLSSSQNENNEDISGNLYSAFSFDEEWELENMEFPIHVFTVNSNKKEAEISKIDFSKAFIGLLSIFLIRFIVVIIVLALQKKPNKN
jgi:C1A family cysteine protease